MQELWHTRTARHIRPQDVPSKLQMKHREPKLAVFSAPLQHLYTHLVQGRHDELEQDERHEGRGGGGGAASGPSETKGRCQVRAVAHQRKQAELRQQHQLVDGEELGGVAQLPVTCVMKTNKALGAPHTCSQ